jgi:signal peptidase II
MARRALGWFFLLLTLALVGCDHATKEAARATLEPAGPVSLVKGVLELCYVQNHDSAFSLTRSLTGPIKPLMLIGLSLVATLAIAATAWRRRTNASRLEQGAVALVAAGAVGNVLDRLRHGYVVDFIHVQYWPVFNVADVLICVGAILLAWSAARTRPRLAD